jgi:MraZ protein
MIFPQDAWAVFSARMAQVKMGEQVLKRIFLGSAMDVEMDGTGRVLVSPELRAAANITKDAILMGMGSHFELWDKATYEKQEAEALQNLPPDALDNFAF